MKVAQVSRQDATSRYAADILPISQGQFQQFLSGRRKRQRIDRPYGECPAAPRDPRGDVAGIPLGRI